MKEATNKKIFFALIVLSFCDNFDRIFFPLILKDDTCTEYFIHKNLSRIKKSPKYHVRFRVLFGRHLRNVRVYGNNFNINSVE